MKRKRVIMLVKEAEKLSSTILALFGVPTFGRCILKADLETRCGDIRPANRRVRRQVGGRRSSLKAKLIHG